VRTTVLLTRITRSPGATSTGSLDAFVHVTRMPELRSLSLDDNAIESLPAAIGRMTALRRLTLRCNRLREVPDELADLVHLEEIDLAGNQLTR
jgi:Leucine-rich repeat (LRR) protein